MKIRYATLEDAEMLSELGARTFYETFAKDNTPQNMEAHLRNSFSPEIQTQELSQSDNVFLIAELENVPVGYAQLILNHWDGAIQADRPLEIRRIYASQEYIGKGIGPELMKASIEEARQRNCDCVWLGVWEKNPRAIAFYEKWGFRKIGTHIFSVGDDPQTDFIMQLELRP